MGKENETNSFKAQYFIISPEDAARHWSDSFGKLCSQVANSRMPFPEITRLFRDFGKLFPPCLFYDPDPEAKVATYQDQSGLYLTLEQVRTMNDNRVIFEKFMADNLSSFLEAWSSRYGHYLWQLDSQSSKDPNSSTLVVTGGKERSLTQSLVSRARKFMELAIVYSGSNIDFKTIHKAGDNHESQRDLPSYTLRTEFNIPKLGGTKVKLTNLESRHTAEVSLAGIQGYGQRRGLMRPVISQKDTWKTLFTFLNNNYVLDVLAMIEDFSEINKSPFCAGSLTYAMWGFDAIPRILKEETPYINEQDLQQALSAFLDNGEEVSA